MGGTFRDLIAWQKAVELTVAVYQSTKKFPADERYGLTANCGARPYRSQATLPKVKGDLQIAISSIS
jgi:hypothetical protein